MEHSGIFTLIHTLASGLLPCRFKSLVFVFQLQFAMHESEHWSRNHAVISAHSINYQTQVQDWESREHSCSMHVYL